jgi:hypothetical protein
MHNSVRVCFGVCVCDRIHVYGFLPTPGLHTRVSGGLKNKIKIFTR